MSFKIVSDSSADLLTLSDIDFVSVPLKIITDEREFPDDEALNVGEMMDYLAKYKGKSRTSCPNTEEYLSAFGDAENIFCLTITKNLSGSFNAARMAAEEYMKKYPERKVHVVDTLTAGAECALLAMKIKELALSGAEFEEIRDRITEYSKHTRLIFALESMHNLSVNGRVSPIVAKLAGVLGIRIVGKASTEGVLEITHKSRGLQKELLDILSVMKNEGYCGGKVLINDAEAENTAKLMADKIKSEFPNADIVFGKTRGLCSFYAERGGLMLGFEVG